jgi:hypothetical protein
MLPWAAPSLQMNKRHAWTATTGAGLEVFAPIILIVRMTEPMGIEAAGPGKFGACPVRAQHLHSPTSSAKTPWLRGRGDRIASTAASGHGLPWRFASATAASPQLADILGESRGGRLGP